MTETLMETVSKIRKNSRELVRELGFMNQTLAGTKLSPSAVHAIIEIGESEILTSKSLSEILRLEKSTISRLVQSLLEDGIIKETRSEEDRRQKNLLLTPKGLGELRTINKYANEQVLSALSHLSKTEGNYIAKTFSDYAKALRADRTIEAMKREEIVISSGYSVGMIGDIVKMHAQYYYDLVGFGAVFEAKVASGLAEFITRVKNTANASWHIETHQNIIATISIDGESLGNNIAHLRWFIVSDRLRGQGAGNKLMQKAIGFCEDKGFSEVHLWTFKGLDTARRLYEKHGFELVAEYPDEHWGENVREQKFVKKL